jgi:uncharacterized protein (TIGR00730 family)
MMKTICVFCGSSKGTKIEYQQACTELAELFIKENITLVYGGGDVGLMGLLADAMLERGGRVIGVIPKALADKEVAHESLTELHIVGSMHERKAMMAELSDGFIAMPGGIGTLEEIIEVFTWTQLGIHSKPCGLLNIAGYYDRLFEFLQQMVDQEFLKPFHLSMMVMENKAEALLQAMKNANVAYIDKWWK